MFQLFSLPLSIINKVNVNYEKSSNANRKPSP